MKAFTYLIREISTGRWYYGVRYAEGCSPSDLFTTYFTSSSTLEPLIRKAPAEFTYEVRREFSCKLKAQDWETKFLKRTNAPSDPMSFNKHWSGSPPMMFGDDNPSTRPEVKAKLRSAALNRPPQKAEVISKISNTKLKQSIALTFRNRNFPVNNSVILISRYEKYIAYIREYKPRCKRMISFLIKLIDRCNSFTKKAYPKNRKSSLRGKNQSISNSKIGTKWFTSPDLLTAKPFHDLVSVPNGWIPGIKLTSRNSKIGYSSRKRFTKVLTKI